MTDATHTVVPYQTPHARAFSAAQNSALGFGAAVLLLIIPLLKDYLDKGVFTKAQTVVLLTTIASGVIGVLGTYVVKYIAAHGNNQPPTVDALGATPDASLISLTGPQHEFMSVQATNATLADSMYATRLHTDIAPPELPGIDPHVLVRLVERNLTDHLDHLEAAEDNRALGVPSPYVWKTGPVGGDPYSVTLNPHGIGTFPGDVVPPVAPEPVVGRRKRVIPPSPEAETGQEAT